MSYPSVHPSMRKKEVTRIVNELRERIGIADVEPVPVEEIRGCMASLIRDENNEFNCEIIEEREK